MRKVGGSLLGLWALLLVTADLAGQLSKDDDCCVIIFVIRTIRAGAAFMNVVNVGHGNGGMVAVLDCEQIPQETSLLVPVLVPGLFP